QIKRPTEPIENMAPAKAPTPSAPEFSASATPAPASASSVPRFLPRGRINRRCIRSLQILLWTIVAFLFALLLGSVPGAAAIAGFSMFLCVGALAWSMGLAIVGLRQCAKYPGSYTGGQVPATITLILGAPLGLLTAWLFVHGVRYSSHMAEVASHRRQAA